MKAKKRDVYELAVKLAHTGEMKNWRSIQDELVRRGHDRAPDLFNGAKIRAMLDICCKQGRAEKQYEK